MGGKDQAMSITCNLQDFIDKMNALQKATSTATVGQVVRGKVITIFKDIVKETPQWSGAAASNWTISINGSSSGAIPSGAHVTRRPEFSKGDESAVSAAFMKNEFVNGYDEEFLNGCVISNPQPYIEYLEEGSLKGLRSMNMPGRMVARSLMKNQGRETLKFGIEIYAGVKL